MAGRPPIPTALLSPDAFKNHPSRRRADPPDCQAIGSPPKHENWNAAKTEIWKEIVHKMPPGVLMESDSIMVELTVEMVYKVRSGKFSNIDVAQLRNCLVQLGMTSSARTRITVVKTPEKNAFDDLDEPVQ